jgi:hypothetical protein
MQELDIPIFKRSYDLYKILCEYRSLIPKQNKYTVFERCENASLDTLEFLAFAAQSGKTEKLPYLQKANLNLTLLKILVRLLKDIKAIDNKKYLNLQTMADEIGRMLGGWIKSVSAN